MSKGEAGREIEPAFSFLMLACRDSADANIETISAIWEIMSTFAAIFIE